jgi:YtcA-like protein
MAGGGMKRWTTAGGATLVCCSGGCDPIFDVEGAYFPGWMLCILVAIALTVLLRFVFVRARIEESLGPLLIIYPSLMAGLTLLLYLALYRS